MDAIRILVLAAASMLVMMMVIISSVSLELTEEEEPVPSPTTASATLSSSQFLSVMEFSIGKTSVSGTVDTGSNLIWTGHSTLFDALPKDCPSDGNNDGITLFPCKELCTFKSKYGDSADVEVKGVMGQAKLTFGSFITPERINIGSAVIDNCHFSSSNAGEAENKACKSYARGGIVGLGRGKLSLVSQLGLRNFSYCLRPESEDNPATTGFINFNDKEAISFEGKTNLVNPEGSLYYVRLEKIQAGSKIVGVPNGCSQNPSSSGYGGMVIDSGTAVTRLRKDAFNAVKKHAEELIKDIKRTDETNCYKGTYPNGIDDSIVLHFCGGQQMKIPAKSYFFKSGDNEFCLAFMESNMSILGAYQQQEMHMQFNIVDNTLSFARNSECVNPQKENHATM